MLNITNEAYGQGMLPLLGNSAKYSVFIEMPKGYISGICVMVNDGKNLNGSIFNEFGISSLSFSYDKAKHKVKLIAVIKMLNKWYIKRVLKKDICLVIENLENNVEEYYDEKHKIKYRFRTILANE